MSPCRAVPLSNTALDMQLNVDKQSCNQQEPLQINVLHPVISPLCPMLIVNHLRTTTTSILIENQQQL